MKDFTMKDTDTSDSEEMDSDDEVNFQVVILSKLIVKNILSCPFS